LSQNYYSLYQIKPPLCSNRLTFVEVPSRACPC